MRPPRRRQVHRDLRPRTGVSGSRSRWRAGDASFLMRASTLKRSVGSSRFWIADDSCSNWCPRVACDGSYRHAQGIRVAIVTGAGGAAARSAQRSLVLLSWTSRRSLEGHLARRPRGLPVHEEIGEGPFCVARAGGRRSNDLAGADILSFVRNRLEKSPGKLASDERGLRVYR